jgi:hypothetical protein
MSLLVTTVGLPYSASSEMHCAMRLQFVLALLRADAFQSRAHGRGKVQTRAHHPL